MATLLLSQKLISGVHVQTKTLTLVPSFPLMRYAWVHQSYEKLGILSSIKDHEIKSRKQGRSPTPADILVDI